MKNLESGIRVAQLLSRYQLYAVILFICMRGAIPGSALADEVDNFIDEIQRASDQVESF